MPVAPSEVDVSLAEEVTSELVEAFARLLPQLSPNAARLSAAELGEMIRAPGTYLLLARERPSDRQGGTILGTVTLVVFRTPSGVRANIESVVVDGAARGRGIGEALCREAVACAERAGADTVDLTSAPARAAANRLYLRLGFQRRETNVYRHVIVRPPCT
jgi:ribosomal protein S18 acetylase RimI-like enzyme